MVSVSKLSDFLANLDVLGARSSREFLGTKEANPAMVIEESVPAWTQTSDMEEIDSAFSVFKEKVCIPGFPPRYSPAFWLAHTALTALYKVLSAHLHGNFTQEVLDSTNSLLFDLWMTLIAAGPGSAHLEMLDVILKNEHCMLWKYMASLEGERLQNLIATLKTDFVYDEDVPSDHYATLMETHIDKVFRHILTPEQYVEAQRGLLDLSMYYLGRMNHVPPHIGPRLSHLCFLISRKYELENPYLGLDDWVVTRYHLKVIKDVVTDRTFTLASEAQYRAPITLEKIFQATLSDNMLQLLFKQFMLLLATICNNNNSKKSRRLFDVYQTSLFRNLELNKCKESPTWMFEPCITTMTQVASTNGIQTHMEELLVCALNECLLKFKDLSDKDKQLWHRLLVNCVVSGRGTLITQATQLLSHPVLQDCGLFHWKCYVKEAKMLVDIVADLPTTFLQDDEGCPINTTVEACSNFLSTLLTQLQETDMIHRVSDNLRKCVIKCVEKGAPIKAGIASMCLRLEVLNFKDMDFIREILFSMEKLLKDPDCPYTDGIFSEVVERLLVTCLGVFTEKRYIPVDYNTLFTSICITCLYDSGAADDTTQGSGDAQKSCDMQKSCDLPKSCDLYRMLYSSVLQPFIAMHQDHGTLSSVSNFVPNIAQLMQEFVVQGTSITRCVQCLQWLGTDFPDLITDHVTNIMELFLDWNCYREMSDLMKTLYPLNNLAVSARLSDMFEKLGEMDKEDRHHVLAIIVDIAEHQTQLISVYRITCLLYMYPYESAASQRLILAIVGHMTSSHPEFLAANFPLLTDDTKFPANSLSDRAPILVRLSQLGEDQCRKTIDYLLKHITSNDPVVAIPAIDALGPLLKANPQYLQKQKLKLKAACKSTNIARVKEVCYEVLPEMNKTSTDVKPLPKETNKTTPSISESKVVKKPPRKTNLTLKTKTEKPAELVTRDPASRPKTITPVLSKSGEDSIKSTKLPHGNNSDKPHIVPLDKTYTNSTTDKVWKDETTQKLEKTVIYTKPNITSGMEVEYCKDFDSHQQQLSEDEEEVFTGDGCSQMVGTGHSVDRINMEEKGEDQVDTKQFEAKQDTSDFVSSQDDVTFSGRTREIGNTVGTQEQMTKHNSPKEPQPQSQQHKQQQIQQQLQPVIDIEGHTLEGHQTETAEQLNNLLEENKNSDERCATSPHLLNSEFHNSPPIYLLFHSASQETAGSLRRHLQMAGYECQSGTEETGSGVVEDCGMDGATVVVICLTQGFLQSTECCNQVQKAIENGQPVIPLLLDPRTRSEGHMEQLLGNRLCVRFYLKPGEVTTTQTCWPPGKFLELLMQLNYLGILRNENIVTEAYRNWWEPDVKEQPFEGREADESITCKGAADVFISYQWSAHRMAVSLFRSLTNLGYQCWLGVYHMGGSESLYNKIVQGLHECRVVVACVTHKFELAENCQQEVIIAHALKRPIIPLVIDTSHWPIRGKVGEILSNHQPVYVAIDKNQTVNLSGGSFEKLIGRLNEYTTGLYDTFGDTVDGNIIVRENGEAKKFNSLSQHEDEQSGNLPENKTNVTSLNKIDSAKSLQCVSGSKNSENSTELTNSPRITESRKPLRVNTLKKSTSLIHVGLQNVSHDMLAQQLVTSKTDDDLIIVKKGYQDNVLLEEHRYARSKSCVIL